MRTSDALASWLRRTGIEVGPTGLPGPEWLAGTDLAPLHQAAHVAERAADEIDEARLGLRTVLGQTAEAFRWTGAAAAAAGRRSGRAGTRLARLAELLRELGHELSRHGASVEDARGELHRVLDEAEYHVGHLDEDMLATPLAVLRAAPSDDGEAVDRLTALHECAARVREVLLEAEADDHARTARLVDLGSAILEVAAGLDADGWVEGVVPAEACKVLRSVGIVPTATERSLAGWVADLPLDAEGARALRERLVDVPTEEVARMLEHHPRLAALLVHGAPPTTTSFGDLDAESRRRLALLHPSVVGNLDAAPLDDRVAANRVAVTAAFFSSPQDDPRSAFYERLLHERVPDPHAPPADQATVGHRLLSFDAASGQVAEVWGRVEPGLTREVALVSSDDPTDLRRFAEVSDMARAAAALDQGLVAVVWTGGGAPDLGTSLPPDVAVTTRPAAEAPEPRQQGT